MKLSINILTWNNWPILEQTLDMLKEELKGLNAEVIVVDNGSTDGIVDNLWRYAVHHIRNNINLGISKGKNQGIDASNGEYILLLDGDIIPVPGSIRKLVEYLNKNNSCMAIGFMPNKFTNRLEEAERECNGLFPIFEYTGHCIYFGIYRREVFELVRFDEDYGSGYGFEDLDFLMQMQENSILQYGAGINSLEGKYYHAINSSFNHKDGLKRSDYSNDLLERQKIFDMKWNRNVK